MIACDLGSNSFRVVKIDCDTKQRVLEFERVVKTAEGISKSGEISEDAVRRIIEAIEDAKEFFDLTDAVAVTTAALRKATNSALVLEKIRVTTGLEFEIISAKMEAKFTRVAVENRLHLENMDIESYVLMDLGGGSTELIFKDFEMSFDIGIVTMVDKYLLDDIEDGIKKELLGVSELAKKIKKPKTFIASSGTPTTIASFLQGMDYESYDYRKINGVVLSIDDINRALRELLKMSESERVRWVGASRDDLIVAGVMIFREILKIFGFYEVLIIDDGLREGVALNRCKKAN